MRVAIVSFDPLPDPRVEREILTMIRNDIEVYFIGPRRGHYCAVHGIYTDKLHCIDNPVNPRIAINFIEPFINKEAEKLKKVINTIKPDIVLSINIGSGYVVSKIFDSGVVIDNHEYFYIQYRYATTKLKSAKSLKRRLIFLLGNYHRKLIYTKFKIEARLAERFPMIFTNNFAARDFSLRFGVDSRRLYVLKNYPSIVEVGKTKNNIHRDYLRFVYLSSTPISDGIAEIPYRDISYTLRTVCKYKKIISKKIETIIVGTYKNLYCFRGIGWLHQTQLGTILGPLTIGLASWKPHPVHMYVNPNKPYIYAGYSSLPLITDALKSVAKDIPYRDVIISSKNFYKDLAEKIRIIIESPREHIIEKGIRIKEFARKNLIWEKQEKTLIDAIRAA